MLTWLEWNPTDDVRSVLVEALEPSSNWHKDIVYAVGSTINKGMSHDDRFVVRMHRCAPGL